MDKFEQIQRKNAERGGLILKAFGENEIEKGGEGSRGGKVIGHTKSGKPIYEDGNFKKDYKDFTSEEHEKNQIELKTRAKEAYKKWLSVKTKKENKKAKAEYGRLVKRWPLKNIKEIEDEVNNQKD